MQACGTNNPHVYIWITAPIAFKSHGIASGKSITSYPSMKERLVDTYQYNDEDRVVVDGKHW